MKVDFSKPPEAFFHAPGNDTGIEMLHEFDWAWRPVEGGTISAFAASDHQNVNDQINSHINTHFNQRRFHQPVEINTIPVRMRDVGYKHSFVSVAGKWVLQGASGTRLRNKYYQKNLGSTPEIDHNVKAKFEQQAATARMFPMANEFDPKLDFTIECRNTFNFYHFLTETLCQLCTAADINVEGRIIILSPSEDVKPFIREWVDAIFPDLKDKVVFQTTPASFETVLSAFNLRHAYCQMGPQVIPDLDAFAPDGWMWQGRKADRPSQALLAMNSFDRNLRRLRERALRLAEDVDIRRFPKRFYVARKPGGPRDRTMRGEDDLVAKLQSFGFQKIYFEDLTPLQQVAIVANAEVMISYHGAGFANMMFANPKTHVLEIGNLQSALYRWADFMPHAHVSGCNYTCFFADFYSDDPSHVPDMRSNNLQPVAIGEVGIRKVITYVEAVLIHPKDIKNHDHLMQIALLLNSGKNFEKLSPILAQHKNMVAANVDLLVMQANCHRHTGNPRGAFDSLSAAWRLTTRRPVILERMVRLAAEISGREAARLLLNLHLKHYPGRHRTFQNHFDWYDPDEP